ncbi:hypothetical protein [Streptomyces sp. RPT161]|uniref:hypothetical protein n=1 Tax=Streptomyces sp. RPT161 TaxID=3015993 RepID=UPI0022B860C0|nr:hypothetical protein [Streptomyces sp. RPT161]
MSWGSGECSLYFASPGADAEEVTGCWNALGAGATVEELLDPRRVLPYAAR